MHSTNSFPLFFLVPPQHPASSHAATATRTRTLQSRFTAAPGVPTALLVACTRGSSSAPLISSAGTPLLAVAGEKAAIRIIHVGRMKTVASLQVRAPAAPPPPANIHFPARLQGHGRSINDLRFLPSDPNMLLSCSSDESCRLWNVVTLQLAVIFGGWNGHRSAVLSLDVHVLGRMFASCGMDNRCRQLFQLPCARDCSSHVTRSIRVWSLNSAEVLQVMFAHHGACSCRKAHTPLATQSGSGKLLSRSERRAARFLGAAAPAASFLRIACSHQNLALSQIESVSAPHPEAPRARRLAQRLKAAAAAAVSQLTHDVVASNACKRPQTPPHFLPPLPPHIRRPFFFPACESCDLPS
jgi:hypothetical protein